jgi:hypothetical protein
VQCRDFIINGVDLIQNGSETVIKILQQTYKIVECPISFIEIKE